MQTESVQWQEVSTSSETPDALPHDIQGFLDFWTSLTRTHGRLPRKSEFDPLDVAPFWRGIAVIEVVREEGREDRYFYRFLGTSHDEVNGMPHSGCYMHEVLPPREVAATQPVFNHVVSSRLPHYWHRRRKVPGQELLGYERILTPFLGKGDTVDFLIGYWKWHWRRNQGNGLYLVSDVTLPG